MSFFRNRRNVIIVSVVAAVVIIGGAFTGLVLVRRKQAAFMRGFTMTMSGLGALARATDAKALTTDQINGLLSVLRPLELEDSIPTKEAKQVMADVKGVLTPDQQAALNSGNARDLFGAGGPGQPGMGNGNGQQPGGSSGQPSGGTNRQRSGNFAGGFGGMGSYGRQGGLNGVLRFILPGGTRAGMSISGRMFTRIIDALEARLSGTTPGQTQ
ncbi:MAG TPA: hypothetical protein VGL40_05065 [Bacillota bacterium]|jgi:uncharacterized membrane protein